MGNSQLGAVFLGCNGRWQKIEELRRSLKRNNTLVTVNAILFFFNHNFSSSSQHWAVQTMT